jgi:hypothetical protein
VPYKGPYRKLPAPTPGDFIEIAPGATLSVQVEIGSAYDFPAGAGRYTVRYEAINPSPQPGNLSEMRSAPVPFELQ